MLAEFVVCCISMLLRVVIEAFLGHYQTSMMERLAGNGF